MLFRALGAGKAFLIRCHLSRDLHAVKPRLSSGGEAFLVKGRAKVRAISRWVADMLQDQRGGQGSEDGVEAKEPTARVRAGFAF